MEDNSQVDRLTRFQCPNNLKDTIILTLMHDQHTAIENIVGKEEIAHDEQLLLFPQCFLLTQIIVPVMDFYIQSSSKPFQALKIQTEHPVLPSLRHDR